MSFKLSARAEALTRRTYNRPLDAQGTKFETWDDTVHRAQGHHQERLWTDAGGVVNRAEMGELVELGLSRAALVAGRTLWLGGTQYAYSRAASQFNCSALVISTVYDMVDAFWLLLNGCGVGAQSKVGTLHGYRQHIPNLHIIPSEKPADYRGRENNVETKPSESNMWTWIISVGDSAESWAKALGKMFMSPAGRCDSLVLDFSECRGRGLRLRGYGWICNGYQPLAEALTAIHRILNDSAGNLLDEEQIGDVFNWCGTVLSSRRAAEALLMNAGHPRQQEFSTRKKDYWISNPQRRQSNNSLVFWQRPNVDDIEDLLEMNYVGGEPGIVNGEAALMKCPWFSVFNPCLTGETLVAVADGRNAVRIDQLAEESQGVNRFPVYSARPKISGKGREWITEISSAVAIMTGVKDVGVLKLSNGDRLTLTPDHRIALADGTYCKASESIGKEVESFFTKAHKTHRRLINSESNGYSKQCRMIWEYYNGPKPEGYDIDHIDTFGGDHIDNLQLLSSEDHRAKSSEEKKGESNPIHRMKDPGGYRARKSAGSFGSRNPRFSGITDEYIIGIAKTLHRDGIPITLKNLRTLDERIPQSLSKNRFCGSIETLRQIVRGEIEYVSPVAPVVEEREQESSRREVVYVESYTPTGQEPVYDLIVEKNRNFYVITSGDESNQYRDSKGILVHNCFEILLSSHGFCNLASLSLPHFGRNFNAMERACWVIARANYRQTCVNLEDNILQKQWHQTNESLRLCGVSLTGIVQASWLTDYQIRRLRNAAVTGAYSMADELGLPRPKAVTTVKPEGTRSKISGTTTQEVAEGMHLPLGRYVFNWVNFAIEDPLVEGLEAAGYKTLPNPSDRNNILVRFPVDYSGCKFGRVNGKEVNNESAISQLERYKRWNNLWADHNVSATISFDMSEVKDIARWIYNNWNSGYIATAFLPRVDATKTAEDYGHPYLPQEVVTEDVFRDAVSSLREINWDRYHTGWFDVDESNCAGGVCPTK